MFPPFYLLLHCHQPQWHERGNQLPGSSSHQRVNLTKRLEDNHQEERERGGGIKILWRIHRQKHKEKQHARVSVEASMLYMLMTARYFRFGGQYSQTGISGPRKPTYISLFNAYTFWIARPHNTHRSNLVTIQVTVNKRNCFQQNKKHLTSHLGRGKNKQTILGNLY